MNVMSVSSGLKGIFIAILLLGGVVLLSFMFDGNNSNSVPDGAQSEEITQDTQDADVADNASAPKSYTAFLQTNKGEITLDLFAEDAPKTVENFVRLARAGFYDGTKFHRVIKDFMIQGGDPFSKDDSAKDRWGTGGPGYSFEDEINKHKLVRGVLAMANAGPNTNGSQFFIITAESTPWLDGLHTPFGKVIGGMDVVDLISNAPTDKANGDKPIENIIVEKIVIK